MHIQVDETRNKIPSHAILRQTCVRARYGSKKQNEALLLPDSSPSDDFTDTGRLEGLRVGVRLIHRPRSRPTSPTAPQERVDDGKEEVRDDVLTL